MRTTISRFFLYLAILVLCSSCGIKKNIEDITDNANQILEELADLSRTVNSSVETGELEDKLGSLVDDRIDKLTDSINKIIQENGGFVFDEVNGTLDNTFDNVRTVIGDIKTGILDDSLPRNIELLSQQLVLNTNNIASHAESLINLTFGNTSIILSQATDAAFTLSVWGIFGVGFVLFILFLIIWGSKMNKNIRNVVFGLMTVFIGLCSSVLFVTPVKALVLKSLSVGEQMIAQAVSPKIISALPVEFEFGNNNKLYLFGTHLENLSRDNLEVALFQSGKKKLAFPDSTIKVITSNKIVLSDFAGSGLGWSKSSYQQISAQYKTLTSKALPANYNTMSQKLNTQRILSIPSVQNKIKSVRPDLSGAIRSGSSASVAASSTRSLSLQPSTALSLNSSSTRSARNASTSVAPTIISTRKLSLNKQLTAVAGVNFTKNYASLLLKKYKIPPGDYELRVTNVETGEIVNSIQHILFENPPPPPPKPDVFPIAMSWVNGEPVKGGAGQLKILLGVVHGEQAENSVNIGLSSNPSLQGLRDIRVNRSVLNAAPSTLTLQSKQFKVNKAGNVNFTARTDVENKIAESNEGNNVKSQTLRVRDYKFKAVVKLNTFTSLTDLDGFTCPDEEYRIDINTSVSGHGEWKVDFNKNGARANQNYNVSRTKTFHNLKEGHKINLFTSGYEKGDCLAGDTGMGSASTTVTIKNVNSKTHEIQLRAKHYIIRGEVKYEKVLLN